MLAILGYLMIITFLFLIIKKLVSPLTGLIVIPLVFGIIGGFGTKLGQMMMDGIIDSAPTAILILFAILYFGIMIDAGLFDPLTTKILKLVKGDPLKVIVGSAILAGIIGFDGDGSSTIMICFSALLPLYLRLGINPIILAVITIMQIGITTLVPWGGPVGRVASVLKLDPTALYISLLPGMIVSLLYVVFIAYIIGKKERARLGIMNPDLNIETQAQTSATIEGDNLKRPKLIWVNFSLTVVLMVALIMSWYPSAILFIVGTAIALLINYPKVTDQAARISSHASRALTVTSIILAAGIFSGILKGTAMSDEMAQGLISIIPSEFGAFMGLIVALISGIGLFFIGPDGFYFGIIPVLAETASAYGVSGMEIGTASLYGTPFGIIGPLVGSMYLLTGMARVNLVDVQKYAGKLSVGILTIFIVFGLVLGHISV